VLLLTGQYFHAFDAKSRLTVPAKLREQINRSEDCYAFMAVYGFDGVLYLYTPKTYAQVAPQFDSALHTKRDVRDYERIAYGLAERLELDRLGRILIPEYTRQQCGLSKEVAVVGVRDHIEIWETRRTGRARHGGGRDLRRRATGGGRGRGTGRQRNLDPLGGRPGGHRPPGRPIISKSMNHIGESRRTATNGPAVGCRTARPHTHGRRGHKAREAHRGT